MKWNLDDILPLNKFDNLYQEVERDIKTLEKWVEKLEPKMSQEEFGKMLEFEEELGAKMAKLGYLPFLMETTNQNLQYFFDFLLLLRLS